MKAHGESEKGPFIEFGHGFAPLIGCKVRITERHADGAVTQEITHGV
jgi:hypothetical protein